MMTILTIALMIVLPLVGMIEEHHSLIPAMPAESMDYDYR